MAVLMNTAASPVENAKIQLRVGIPPKENVVDIEIAVAPCDVVLDDCHDCATLSPRANAFSEHMSKLM